MQAIVELGRVGLRQLLSDLDTVIVVDQHGAHRAGQLARYLHHVGRLDRAGRRHRDDERAVFIFPYPAGILQGDALWRAKDVAQRWRSVVMSDRTVTRQGDIALLAYHVSAERKDAPAHEALCSSVYLRDDDAWRRLTHQETPVTLPPPQAHD